MLNLLQKPLALEVAACHFARVLAFQLNTRIQHLQGRRIKRFEDGGQYGGNGRVALEHFFKSLDTPTLQMLNARIQLEGQDPRKVASGYLQSKGFLK